MPLLNKTFIPLTATTFGDWLSPRARAHYHKSQISTVGSNYNSFLIRLVERRIGLAAVAEPYSITTRHGALET